MIVFGGFLLLSFVFVLGTLFVFAVIVICCGLFSILIYVTKHTRTIAHFGMALKTVTIECNSIVIYRFLSDGDRISTGFSFLPFHFFFCGFCWVFYVLFLFRRVKSLGKLCSDCKGKKEEKKNYGENEASKFYQLLFFPSSSNEPTHTHKHSQKATNR